MPIDLLELAKQVEETYYKDVELSFGETVRVYHTPEPMIWKYKPNRPAPSPPTIKMKIATGQHQNRFAKEGDPEYHDWLKVKEIYDEEMDDIRLAARYVLALRDVQYPSLEEPPPIYARYMMNGSYPENDLLRKKVWLDCTYLARTADMIKIQAAMMELAGQGTADAGAVESIKKNSGSSLEDDELDTPDTQT